MKKTIFAIIIMLLIIGAGIGEQIYLDKLFNEISDGAVEARQYVENENMVEALEKSKEIRMKWDNQKHFAEAIISHNETREVSARLAELEGYVSANDPKSAIATAEIIADTCQNLEHILGFKWDTIL